jgi:hypothetical protein
MWFWWTFDGRKSREGRGPGRFDNINSERNNPMTAKAKQSGTEYFDQALRNYDQAFKMSLKWQEDATRMVTDFVHQKMDAAGVTEGMEKVLKDTVPTAQKQFDDTLKTLDANAQKGLEMMRQSLDVASAKDPTEAQKKINTLMKDSVDFVQEQIKSLTKANNQMIESWMKWTENMPSAVGVK